jgi:hypothetical protein
MDSAGARSAPLQAFAPAIALATACVAACAFALGFFIDSVTLKPILVGAFALVGAGVLALPYRWAIRILFFYEGFEGMLKILSGYNPVIHVGSDLLVVALSARWFLELLLRRTSFPEVRPPLLVLFGAHVVWFAIEFLNPYALGLIPSLAGAKMYITMGLLYGYGYYLATDRREVRWFMGIWVAIAGIQIATGLYQGAVGPSSVLSLHPGYAAPLRKFAGYAFRPFGTTALPGGAAELIHLALPFSIYFVLQTRSLALRLLLLAALPLALTTMALCQVRVSILKSILGVGAFLLLALPRLSREAGKRALIFVPAAVLLLFFALPRLTSQWVGERAENAFAIERSLSLFDFNLASRARAGALGRIIYYASEVPLGAGVSRTGAAVERFHEYLDQNQFYNQEFFGDNFWASTIAEIGIPGSAILTGIVFSILALGFLGLRRTRDPELATLQAAILCSVGMLVVGFWGGEAILYNPEAMYFWFFSGVLMRLPSLETA